MQPSRSSKSLSPKREDLLPTSLFTPALSCKALSPSLHQLKGLLDLPFKQPILLTNQPEKEWCFYVLGYDLNELGKGPTKHQNM